MILNGLSTVMRDQFPSDLATYKVTFKGSVSESLYKSWNLEMVIDRKSHCFDFVCKIGNK